MFPILVQTPFSFAATLYWGSGARIMYNRIASRHQLQIPTETKIGRGLYIGHGICIVINGETIIVNNCSLSQFLTIGSNKGTPATIGDNVYIGPMVSIVEDVHIGNNVRIGAGSIVIKNVPDNTTTVGNPNRIIFSGKVPDSLREENQPNESSA